jgi:O-antigen biosynthesis protein WbqP
VSRFINLVFSLLIAFILVLPILLISILIFLKDREYPLYFSPRIGKNNKTFLMPKFRTMRSNTPQEASHLLTNPDDYLLSTGRFLRKYSLDEFPQIISIIKGDMAFVGPRPALFNQHDLISQRDLKEISQLKPGITGWAQVNGRDELSIEEKVQYDEEYLRRASMGFDIYIIWLTIIKVIKKDGISH